VGVINNWQQRDLLTQQLPTGSAGIPAQHVSHACDPHEALGVVDACWAHGHAAAVVVGFKPPTQFE
jgi:hypothetical protein